MKITPLGERVLIKQAKASEEKTKSGLYLPKSTSEKKEGIVVDVGLDKNGRPLPLMKGDKILYGGYSSEDFEIDGEKHIIIKFEDVVAKVEN
ncbi:co-chaperone GroES [Candidatus Pacearchaeota archaeon]|nr:co-chaperone GroES [Candidatus Pacearchaeota archaeon]